MLCIIGLVCCVLVFNTQLLSAGSFWCDQRVQQLVAEKDKSMRQAVDQMHEALQQQDASVEALRSERAASRALRKKLARLARGDRKLERLLKAAEASVEEAAGGTVGGGGGGGGGDGTANGGDSHQRQQAPPLAHDRPHDDSPPSPPASAASAGAPPSLVPSSIAVVVIAYNRPQYLERALTSVFAHHPGGDSFPVYVSQDGDNAAVAAVVAKHGAHRLVHPRRTLHLKTGTYLSKFPGYAYLAVHYGWALSTLFNSTTGGGSRPYQGVIILEEDIEVSPDFFPCVPRPPSPAAAHRCAPLRTTPPPTNPPS
jgi:hypothetical protein